MRKVWYKIFIVIGSFLISLSIILLYTSLINGTINAVDSRGKTFWSSYIGVFFLGFFLIVLSVKYWLFSSDKSALDYNLRVTDSTNDNCKNCKYCNSKSFKGFKLNCKYFRIPTNENYICDVFDPLNSWE